MTRIARRLLLSGGLATAMCACASLRTPTQAAAASYVCPPCGCAMDGVMFSAPGTCPACGMTLVAQQTLPFEPNALQTGASAFLAAGGVGRTNARIQVDYYKPRSFTPQSRVLLVIPGAGRDGDEYRDAWIETAEQHSVLVAALGYPESDYDFAAYHMGGVIRDLSFSAPADARVVHLRDEDIVFTPNPRPDQWLFNDFDRVFSILKAATGSEQAKYDMFGHSAGGQILHRLVLFHPDSRAQRIVAANSGFYTLPDLQTPLLFGLGGSGVDAASLTRSFARQLTLLLGENDNSDAAGGTHLHTPLADQQGIGRLQRGRYFFHFAGERAHAMNASFAWRLQTEPNVAHDFRAMSLAAASLLYT
jgi:pimeloyl-ACP methyl ester carboxylesterase